MTYREAAVAPEPDRSILVVALSGRLIGIDRETGDVRWENEMVGGGRGEVFIAIGYGVVIASAYGAKIFCVDYLTGATRWEQSTHSSGRASIIIEPDRIVCAKAGYLDCYAPDGKFLWQQPLRGQGMGRVALGFPGNVAQADDPGSQ
jgi:outer membrane protein assembly factor BamB